MPWKYNMQHFQTTLCLSYVYFQSLEISCFCQYLTNMIHDHQISLKLNSESSKPQTLKKLFNAFEVKRLIHHYFPSTFLCFRRLQRKFRYHLKYRNHNHNYNYHHITSTFILTSIFSGGQLERVVEHLAIYDLLVPVNCCHSSYLWQF